MLTSVAPSARVKECGAAIVGRSEAGYSETTSSLPEAIEGHGLTVFARVDHAAGARGAGLELI